MREAKGAAAAAEAVPSRSRTARWRDLRKRALSAALLLPTAILCIWLGAEAWTAMMAVACALLAWEWVRLCGYATRRLPGMAVPLAVLAAGTAAVEGAFAAAVGLLAAGAILVAGLAIRTARRRPDRGARKGAAAIHPAWLAFGVLYIGATAVALVHLRGDAAVGRANVLFLFLVVWASDIGAYVAGRAFGGPKLAPAVSPNKTWSGALGGLLWAVTAGMIAAYVMEGRLSGGVLPVAAALGLVSQVGDLFESWIKRRFHVKDSSSLIPGHGGLLDRLDGVLAAAPAAALIGLWHGAGGLLWH